MINLVRNTRYETLQMKHMSQNITRNLITFYQIIKFDHNKCLKEEVEVLYTALIDVLETVDTTIPCCQFSSMYSNLQKINADIFKSTLHEQYQVKMIYVRYTESLLDVQEISAVISDRCPSITRETNRDKIFTCYCFTHFRFLKW